MSEIPTWLVGNRNPSITEVIVDDNGDPVDLNSPVSTVKFKARLVGSAASAAPLVDQTAVIVQTGSGVSAVDKGAVRYDWSAADIAADGILADPHNALVWWEVTTGGKKQDLMEALIEVRAHGQAALAGSAYVELEELKDTLTLKGNTFADRDLQRGLVAASRAVDYLAGQRFYPDVDANQVRYYTATASRVIRIDPLITLTSLQSAFDGINFDSTWTVGTDFVLEPRSAPQDGEPYRSIRRLYYGGYWGFEDTADFDRFLYSWPRSPDSIKVTGKFGWAEVPAGVKNATSLIATRMFKAAREAPWGVAGFDEQGAVRIARTIPDLDLMIGRYTRRKLLV